MRAYGTGSALLALDRWQGSASYEWFAKYSAQNYELQNTKMGDIIAAGGSHQQPDTCARVLQHLADAGVDEVLLFMQSYSTPHDAIMRPIELFAKK
jgi:hypothetical protein